MYSVTAPETSSLRIQTSAKRFARSTNSFGTSPSALKPLRGFTGRAGVRNRVPGRVSDGANWLGEAGTYLTAQAFFSDCVRATANSWTMDSNFAQLAAGC